MKLFSLILILVSFSQISLAQNSEIFKRQNQRPKESVVDQNVSNGESDLVRAIQNRRQVNFLEAQNLKIVKVLPEDRNGLKHQLFIAELINTGYKVTLVYNLDMCERVPAREGDVVAAGGMFLWTSQGPMLHWLHHDPRGNRPDGYIELNGKFYCK